MGGESDGNMWEEAQTLASALPSFPLAPLGCFCNTVPQPGVGDSVHRMSPDGSTSRLLTQPRVFRGCLVFTSTHTEHVTCQALFKLFGSR